MLLQLTTFPPFYVNLAGPALANKGTVHFPLSSLVAGADSIELAPALASNFHWINEPKLISNFKGIKPWNKILDVLTGKTPQKS